MKHPDLSPARSSPATFPKGQVPLEGGRQEITGDQIHRGQDSLPAAQSKARTKEGMQIGMI